MTLRLRSGQALAFVLTLLAAGTSYAQGRDIGIRPFFLVTGERFAAQTTFDATFQSTTGAFWGAGVDVVVRRHYFIDLAISRMSKTGQRAFLNNGDVFRLGIPLKIDVTPVELTGGYRFHIKKWPVTPYAGAGIGWYSDSETADFAAGGDDVQVRHAGFVGTAGAEFRLRRWIAVSGDAQYTRITGILGQGGISKDAGESDLGGIAGRVRVILGR